TMHLAEKVDVAETFAAIGFQAAAGIMDIIPNENLAEKIRDTGRDFLAPRIIALLTPSGNHIISLAHFLKQQRDVGWIILEIAIHRNDYFTFRRFETRIECGCLPEVLSESDQLQR